MRGQMMDFPLNLKHILNHNANLYGQKQVVSKVGPEGVHRYTYSDFQRRVRKLANVLRDLGVERGDRVATFAWNHFQHLELYFAIPCIGAVLHTINIRLFPQQMAYIFNHAQDKVVFIDPTLVQAVERIQDKLETIQQYVMLGSGEIPDTSLEPTLSYEALMAEASDEYDFPDLDENEALGLCYTSGTTGNPKGVLYSHRSIFLHSFASAMANTLNISEDDVIFPVVPMFHANAWGLPFTALLTGADLVFPGPFMQPEHLAQLIQDEHVSVAAGVPTLWIGLYHLLQKETYDLSALRTMIVGGSAAPRSLIEGFEEEFGVPITHAWGMTEMAPLGTIANLKSYMMDWDPQDKFDKRAKQGLPVAGVEMRIVDDTDQPLPWDGETMGAVQVRGPWVAGSYYNDPEANEGAFTEDGWFRTGDVATIDSEGYMEITDRTKDLIKSGGEWISSVALENEIMAHPKVMEAAVIAVDHPKWQERPLAVVVPAEGHADDISKEDVLAFLEGRVASWWMPDDVVFIDEIPKTSVGKFDKKVLRSDFEEYELPTE